MQNYNDLIKNILENGSRFEDRTGVGTIGSFAHSLRWNLQEGFPAVTSKKLAWKSVVSELLWFLEGSTSVKRLSEILHGHPDGKTIWTDNYEKQGKDLGYTDGELGPVYGAQWRDFNGIDQIKNLLENLRNDIDLGRHTRRHLVSAWNPSELPKMALPPCHWSFQCFLDKDKKLSLLWNQRSVDMFLGLPFNIASYALLTHIMAYLLKIEVGELIFNGGDCHIYTNHVDAVETMLGNEVFDLPTIEMPKIDAVSLDDYLSKVKVTDFKLINYQHAGTIKAPMAV